MRADSGLWELPGGKQEPGESLADCLERELKEELGVKVAVGPLFRREAGRHQTGAFTLHCFHCRIIKGVPAAMEHRELAWVDPSRAPDFELCPVDRKILRSLAAERQPEKQISTPG